MKTLTQAAFVLSMLVGISSAHAAAKSAAHGSDVAKMNTSETCPQRAKAGLFSNTNSGAQGAQPATESGQATR